MLQGVIHAAGLSLSLQSPMSPLCSSWQTAQHWLKAYKSQNLKGINCFSEFKAKQLTSLKWRGQGKQPMTFICRRAACLCREDFCGRTINQSRLQPSYLPAATVNFCAAASHESFSSGFMKFVWRMSQDFKVPRLCARAKELNLFENTVWRRERAAPSVYQSLWSLALLFKHE